MTIEGLKNIKTVGTLVASSKYLSKKILRGIDFSKDLTVVELGGGNGAITKNILNRLSPGSELHSFEVLPKFYNELSKIQDSRLQVHNSCMSKTKLLKEGDVDVVISCLPIANFNESLKDTIFSKVKYLLKEDGQFRQFQYSLIDYRYIRDCFDNLNMDYCLFNIPPAFIYKSKNINPA